MIPAWKEYFDLMNSGNPSGGPCRPIPGPKSIIQAHLSGRLSDRENKPRCIIHYINDEGLDTIRVYDHIPPAAWTVLILLTSPGDKSRIIPWQLYSGLLEGLKSLGGWYHESGVTERP